MTLRHDVMLFGNSNKSVLYYRHGYFMTGMPQRVSEFRRSLNKDGFSPFSIDILSPLFETLMTDEEEYFYQQRKRKMGYPEEECYSISILGECIAHHKHIENLTWKQMTEWGYYKTSRQRYIPFGFKSVSQIHELGDKVGEMFEPPSNEKIITFCDEIRHYVYSVRKDAGLE